MFSLQENRSTKLDPRVLNNIKKSKKLVRKKNFAGYLKENQKKNSKKILDFQKNQIVSMCLKKNEREIFI